MEVPAHEKNTINYKLAFLQGMVEKYEQNIQNIYYAYSSQINVWYGNHVRLSEDPSKRRKIRIIDAT